MQYETAGVLERKLPLLLRASKNFPLLFPVLLLYTRVLLPSYPVITFKTAHYKD